MIFAIPYEGRFTLVGTTDLPVEGEPGLVEATFEEIAYLCKALGGYFAREPTPAEVVWTYAGVRPLHDDGHANASKVTRDYVLDLDVAEGAAPLLSVYGGKITTFRKLSEHALQLLGPRLGVTAPAWTRSAKLPGGDIGPQGFDAFRAETAHTHPWIGEPHLTRLCRAYGSRLPQMLGEARSWTDMGQGFSAGLTAREAAYLKRVEWAKAAEDVLWRRSKLGLHMSPAERDAFAAAFSEL